MSDDRKDDVGVANTVPEKHVFIATPCYGGMVTQTYMQSVLALVTEFPTSRILFSIAMLGQDALITRSRNTLVAQFLRSRATDMLFIDADIGFTPPDVLRLVQANKDVIGGLYPLRAQRWTEQSMSRLRSGEPLCTAPLDYVGEPVGHPDRNGLVRANFAGTGFLLISRTALTRLTERYPETRCRHSHVATDETSREIFALFDCLIEPGTLNYLSEDYAFCSRWRAIGGEIWLDTQAKLTHCGMSEFAGNPGCRWIQPAEPMVSR